MVNPLLSVFVAMVNLCVVCVCSHGQSLCCVCSHGQYAAQQKEVFIRQIKMALEMQLPLVVHCREAEDDCLQILEEVLSTVVLCANLGFTLSIS